MSPSRKPRQPAAGHGADRDRAARVVAASVLATGLVAATLASPPVAAAATYYVASGGSDGADGSSGAPWATLEHASDQVAPGDEVIVRPGRYAGFSHATSGRADAPIVFRAEGPGVVIDKDSDMEGSGIHLTATSHVTIEGFHVLNASGRGIAHRGATADSPVTHLVIRGNTVESAGREGMYLSQVSMSLIEGNTIRDAGASGADRTHGIYLANGGSDRTILRGNDISGSGTAGIHFNGDASIGGDGIISGLVVENNLLHDNGQNGLNMDGVQDSMIQNNVIWGNASNGIRAYVIDGAAGPRDLTVVHNTIHVPAGAGWCVRVTDYSGLVVFDNILVNEGSNGSIGVDETTELTSDYNAVVDVFTPDRDASYLSLAEWQALGLDASSFLASIGELVVGAGTGDYRLGPSSPAIDRGVATLGGRTAPSADLLGNARPAGSASDLGAYERCEGACVTAPDGGPAGADGGPGGADAGPTGRDGGSTGGPDAGSTGVAGDGGCGCAVVGGALRGWPAPALLLVIAPALRRRRWRRPAPRERHDLRR